MFSGSKTSITINEYDEEEEVLIIGAEERVKRYGIEIASASQSKSSLTAEATEGVNFAAGTWKPGGQYVQKLIVRNVTTFVKKLKYRLPSTQYFSMAYPEPITLSPGLSYEIIVTFKPIKYESYNDCIYFTVYDQTGRHSFYIPVCAMIDKLAIECPAGIDFGYCTVNQRSIRTFTMSNTGEVDAPFRWQVPYPFVANPMEGTISKGKSLTVKISIEPTDASVYVSQCICYVGENVTAIIPDPILTMNVSAVGKYSFISLSEEKLTFSDILVGKRSKKSRKEIVLRNSSVVPTSFVLSRHRNDCDDVFDINPKSGELGPNSETIITVEYYPLAYGSYSCEAYSFVTPGNCTATFICEGKSHSATIKYSKDHDLIAPSAAAVDVLALARGDETKNTAKNTNKDEFKQLTSNCLDFGDLALGDVCSRTLYVKNESDDDVYYDINAEVNGIFSLDTSKRSKIPANGSLAIKITFKPTHPSNYYRRFFVLLSHNHPIFFDCFGTGFIRGNMKQGIEERRPAPLKYEHIQAYHNRLAQGLGHLSPNELDDLFKSIRHEKSGTRTQFIARKVSSMDLLKNQTGESAMNDSISVGSLTSAFGQTKPLDVPTVKHPLTRSGESTRDVIAITHDFFLHNTDYEVEPLSNSSNPSGSTNIITLNHNFISFGYTKTNTISGCQYIKVTNHSNGEIVACWEINETSGFEIIPNTIDIPSNKTEIFEIRFKPSNRHEQFKRGVYYEEIELYCYFSNQRTFRLVKDPTLTPPWCRTIKVVGYTIHPSMLGSKMINNNNSSLEIIEKPKKQIKIFNSNIHHNKLTFPSCYINDSVFQSVLLWNMNDHSIVFTCKFPSIDGQEVFSCQPTHGLIDSHGFAIIYIRFHPNQIKRYQQSLQVMFYDTLVTSTSNLDQKMKRFDDDSILFVEGFGSIPFAELPDVSYDSNEISTVSEMVNDISLQANGDERQGYFYLQPTSIGLSTTKLFKIKNSSRLPLRYRIEISPDIKEDDCVLNIYPLTGIIQGNNSEQITITFSPGEIQTYENQIRIKIYSLTGETISKKTITGTEVIVDSRQPGKVTKPELLQDLCVNIIGNGEQGAIFFNPSKLVADVRLVNTSETKELYLENISCSTIEYELFYQTIFYPDSSGGVIQMDNTETSDLEPLIIDTSNGDSSRRNPFHNLFCSVPKGLIHPRSRMKVLLTFYPIKSGLFEFIIHVKLKSNDNTNQSFVQLNDSRKYQNETFSDEINDDIMITNEKALLKRLSISNQSINLSKYYHIHAKMTARAAFPTILVQDIRLSPISNVITSINTNNKDHPGSSVYKISDLWKQFSLKQLNFDLAQPLTEQECLLFNDSSPDKTKYSRYAFYFTPGPAMNPLPTTNGSLLTGPSQILPPLSMAILGANQSNIMNVQSIDISICNQGFLESSFHFHYPNEKELDLEAWCMEMNGFASSSDPSTSPLSKEDKANLMNIILEDMKYFTVYPMSAKLQPGESTVITMTYTHSLIRSTTNGIGVGEQRLPLLVKIDHGRQFFIDLIGKTLPPGPSIPSLNGSRLNKSTRIGRRSSFTTVMSGGTNKSMKSIAAPTTITNITSMSRKSNRSFGSTNIIKVDDYPNLLSSQQLLLWIPTPSNTKIYDLYPVPIGCSMINPPKQNIEIYNLSGYPINYEVNMNTIMNQDQSLQCPLIRISNPIGIIEARSSTYLNVYFYPLQVKDYLFPLQIKYFKAKISSTDRIIEENESGSGLQDDVVITNTTMNRLLRSNKPSSSSLHRGISKKNTSNSSKSNIQRNFTSSTNNINQLMNNEECYLDIFVRVRGYDPRIESLPLPYGSSTIGGLPSNHHLIKYSPNPDSPENNSSITKSTDILQLSYNELDFGNCPQYSTNRQLLILKNTSPDGNDVEFYINADESMLYSKEILTIEPMRGKLAKDEIIYIHLKCIGNTNPIIFTDDILHILAREVIIVAGTRRQSLEDRLKEKYNSSKTNHLPPIEYYSVINHITQSRLNYLDQTQLPYELTPVVPTTVNIKGKLVTYETSLANDAIKSTTFRSIHSNVDDTNGLLSSMEGLLLNDDDDDTGFHIKDYSRIQSPNHSENTSSLARSASSVFSPKKVKAHKEHVTYSEKSLFTIRLKGSILPCDVTQYMKVNSNQSLSQSRSDITINDVNYIPTNIPYLSPQLMTLDNVNKPPNTILSTANKLTKESIDQRQHEVRDITENIIMELFSSMIQSNDMNDYLSRTVNETLSINSLQVKINEREFTIEGKPQKGVIYSDLEIAVINDEINNENGTIYDTEQPLLQEGVADIVIDVLCDCFVDILREVHIETIATDEDKYL